MITNYTTILLLLYYMHIHTLRTHNLALLLAIARHDNDHYSSSLHPHCSCSTPTVANIILGIIVLNLQPQVEFYTSAFDFFSHFFSFLFTYSSSMYSLTLTHLPLFFIVLHISSLLSHIHMSTRKNMNMK